MTAIMHGFGKSNTDERVGPDPKQPGNVAHHCLQTMGRTQRSALASRCPKICTMRSVGSAVMLVEQISSR